MMEFVTKVQAIGMISPDMPDSIAALREVFNQLLINASRPKNTAEVPPATDDFGKKIQGQATKAFKEISSWNKSIANLEEASQFIRKIRSPFFPGSLELADKIDCAAQMLRLNKPKAVCPLCNGSGHSCELCENLGALPEYKAQEFSDQGMANWDGPFDDEDEDEGDDFEV